MRENATPARSRRFTGLSRGPLERTLGHFLNGHRIDQAIKRVERSNHPLAVLYLDLNDFKAVNEEYGYDGGNELFGAGVGLAVGDSGTGYSSLFYLRRLEAHALKINPFFTQELRTEEETGAVVRTVLEIADRFGVDTVADPVD